MDYDRDGFPIPPRFEPVRDDLVVGARDLGAHVSISSLRVDNLEPRMLRALAAGGTRTVTVAPEAGSERGLYLGFFL